MREKHIPVGIYNNEVFIATIENGKVHRGIDGKPVFDVIRPVTAEMLENLRDIDYCRDEYRDEWKDAVAANATEEGFDDWLEGLWDEEFDEDDEESFPSKDDSFTEYLTGQDRLDAEAFLENNGHPTIGTWEASGSFPPTFETCHEDGWYSDFKGFDYVFRSPEAEEIARDFEGR